jgi:hypothetical protein
MPYIPTQDASFVQWARNFSTLLSADPPLYGLTAPDAAVVAGQFAIFDAAYQAAIDPITRTQLTVLEKDGEKVTMLGIARLYAAQIRANEGVADEDKTALGLHIPDPTPTPIPTPTTYPLISVLLAASGIHQLFLTDQTTPDTKAKPQGVAGCLLYALAAATPRELTITDPVYGIVTRADYTADTSAFTPGQHAMYAARWFNRKGELGPIGPTASFIVA